jgi:predicted DCC family thiol-disulfide oxidoreductase YuxK
VIPRPRQTVRAGTSTAIVLFDGVCTLCNRWVRFVTARDREVEFRFAALGTEPARRVLQGLPAAGPLPDSLVLVEQGRIYTRSTAALRIARRLGFPWNAVYGLILVPRPIRDAIYDVVARHRYRWFGKETVCRLPTADERRRLLE